MLGKRRGISFPDGGKGGVWGTIQQYDENMNFYFSYLCFV